MNILKSAEDYLEMILMLSLEKGYARSVDIAAGLSVTKPSVSVAMRKLRENGYIEVDENGFILLTPSGRSIAERMLERHRILTELLRSIGVSDKIASDDACRIEHVISVETFNAICSSTKSLLKERGIALPFDKE